MTRGRHLLPLFIVLAVLPGTGVAAARPLNGDDPLRVASQAVRATHNPLSGARFFVDEEWGLANRAERVHRSHYALLHKIAREPETKRFGGFSGNHPGGVVREYLVRAARADRSAVPVLSVYRLEHRVCGHHADSPASQRAYRGWIASFARGVGRYRAVIFLEQDALITTGCLSSNGVGIRMGELRYAAKKLGRLPHVVTYMDAGASDAVSAGRTARMLRAGGVGYIHGFFLNATHFNWTIDEIHFGNRVSRAVGGKHFVVNTATNGRGPLRPRSRVRSGNEVLCNPPGRGLGPRPTTKTGFRGVDAFMWIGNVGRSGGKCRPGAPATGAWWLDLALAMSSRANQQLGPGYPSRQY